jgi:glucokinase
MYDVGGTSIKAGLLTEQGNLFKDQISSFDSKAKGSKSEILHNFVHIANELLLQTESCSPKILGVGMAFPGPFDYERGISYMTGIDKYDAIYGCQIREELTSLLRQSSIGHVFQTPLPFVFLNDIEAFAIGECNYGKASMYQRVMYLCIGTGAGSAFTIGKQIAKKESEQVPENGWIYNYPFKESILDDYVSVRGLRKITEEYFTSPPDGLALSQMAHGAHPLALAVFQSFGETVCLGMKPFLEHFQPNAFVLGGQISKSFSFFGKELTEYCKEKNITILLSEDTSQRILQGLYKQITGISLES